MSTEEDESWESLCAGVGAALIDCQIGEKVIVFCLAHLFPDEPVQSFEMLQRRMLGKLIGELRKRVGPADKFETLLSDFLEHRNTLVHDLGRVKGNDPSTPEGIAAIKDFAFRTSLEARQLNAIFIALIDAWIEQHEWREKLISEMPHLYGSRLLVELRKILGPHLQDLVFKKPSELSKGDNSPPAVG
jgi:hypothetical protein